jgi:hypothetical protein
VPNIFELFERLEAEYAHLPRLPIVFGDGGEAAEKTVRRLKEQEKQEAIQAQRVRKVDKHGVARGLGKRKSATAHVRLWENTAGVSGAQQTVNGKPMNIYFANLAHRQNVLAPFIVSGTTGGLPSHTPIYTPTQPPTYSPPRWLAHSPSHHTPTATHSSPLTCSRAHRSPQIITLSPTPTLVITHA